jgi:hypothetical protein
MLIILDYDETYTAAPAMWDRVIGEFKAQGAQIVCCTMRPPGGVFNEDVETDMGQHDIPIVYSALHPDKWHAMEDAGYIPEDAIWIDDRPMYIYMGNPGDID